MLLRIPYLPVLRLEPLRAARRAWLWLTAPGLSRLPWHGVEIRSLSDVSVLNAFRAETRRYLGGLSLHATALKEEAERRGLPTNSVPQWLHAVNSFYPDADRMALAERLLRP